MIFEVKVVPNAKKTSIEREENKLRVRLTKTPQKGKANKQLIELLAKYFKTSKSNIKIVRGLTSRRKVVDILV